MPKSKRAKVVHLSKVDKKHREHNEKQFSAIREAAETYDHIFVFSVENMRNTYLKQVRVEFADSRIFFGKTKVMAKALGSTAESEFLPNLSKLTALIAGDVGLLFTSRSTSSILDHFANYNELDYSRAGTIASRSFKLPAGVVHSRGGEIGEEEDVPLSHSLEATVRERWDVPTRLVRGQVVLDEEWEVCREGQVLDSKQTALLKLFGVVTAEFRVLIKAYWSKDTEIVTIVEDNDAMVT